MDPEFINDWKGAMKRILLFDTSIGSFNIGDEIINRSIELNWPELFSENYVMRLGSHTPLFSPLQRVLSRGKLEGFRQADLKFLCGTNALYRNMFRPLPAWNVNHLNTNLVRGTICLGVGVGVNSRQVNAYTRTLYRKVLAHDTVHSVRDEAAKALLESVGLRAWNTGCPTLWGLTPDHCGGVPRARGESVVFTLTCYQRDPRNDREMISILKKLYSEIYFWPQCMEDLTYLHDLGETARVQIIAPNLRSYRAVLDRGVDYVGNRLHGGIFALQRGCRTIIISIDYRAREMGKNYSLPLVERDRVASELSAKIESEWETRIDGLDFALIDRWKAQFDVGS